MRLSFSLNGNTAGNIPPIRLECFIKDDNHRRSFLWLSYCAFTLDIVIRYIIILLNKLPFNTITTVLFVPVLFFFLIYKNWNKDVVGKILQNDLAFIILFYFYALVSFLLHESVRYYILNNLSDIVFKFPFFFLFGVAFTTDIYTKRKLSQLAKIIILLDLAYVFYATINGQIFAEDSMERAYRMVPGVMFLVLEFFDKKNIWNFLWAAFSSIYLLTCGNRGAIMVLLGFILYCLVFRSKSQSWKKVLSLITILGAIAFFYSPLFLSALNSLLEVFKRFGLSTRNIQELINGTFISNDNGRDVLFQTGLEMLKSNPWGYGIFGEYELMPSGVHNMYLQFLIHFGIFFGPFLILLILYIIFSAYSNNPNQYAQDFIAIWACRVLIKGLAGGSYLNWEFAFLLGLCVREIRNKKVFYPNLS